MMLGAVQAATHSEAALAGTAQGLTVGSFADPFTTNDRRIRLAAILGA